MIGYCGYSYTGVCRENTLYIWYVPDNFADMVHTVGSCTHDQISGGLCCACTYRVDSAATSDTDTIYC